LGGLIALLHHRSREETPAARGRAFGSAHRAAIDNTIAVYRRMLAAVAGLGSDDLERLGTLVGASVTAAWPALGDELSGMADGAGVEPGLLWAVNARTELLGGGGECSLIGRVDGSAVRIAQNWDWHPELAASRVLWTVEHDGSWFTTFTEAGMLAKLGLNGRGIACGLNFLSSSLDGGADGVPVHVLLRLVLQECGSLVEAMRLLLAARTSASACVTLAGAEARGAGLVAIELSPGGPAVVWPDRDGVLVHTNHFLGALPSGRDLEPLERPGTLLRRERLLALVAGGAGDREALGCHFPASEPVCRHDDVSEAWADRRATLLSVVLDPRARSFEVAATPPCGAPFERVPLP
jgi:isopenicillin-N N-acyltransferase like protein